MAQRAMGALFRQSAAWRMLHFRQGFRRLDYAARAAAAFVGISFWIPDFRFGILPTGF